MFILLRFNYRRNVLPASYLFAAGRILCSFKNTLIMSRDLSFQSEAMPWPPPWMVANSQVLLVATSLSCSATAMQYVTVGSASLWNMITGGIFRIQILQRRNVVCG